MEERKFYELHVAGLTRQLPLCEVNPHLDIAGFVIFGDVEMTVNATAELLKKCPDFDYIVTAEAKGIPLAYEFARQSGKPYYVARKALKLYMTDPIDIEVKSITTMHVQHLYLDGAEAAKLKGKKVLVVDDVISTGESLKALETLLENTGCEIVGRAAILAEGDAAKRDDIIFLEELPLFEK